MAEIILFAIDMVDSLFFSLFEFFHEPFLQAPPFLRQLILLNVGKRCCNTQIVRIHRGEKIFLSALLAVKVPPVNCSFYILPNSVKDLLRFAPNRNLIALHPTSIITVPYYRLLETKQ